MSSLFCNWNNTDTSELSRRMSFTSASMAFGSFPDDCNMCDPIINAAIFMKELPEMEDMIKMVNYALSFERMSGGMFHCLIISCICICSSQTNSHMDFK